MVSVAFIVLIAILIVFALAFVYIVWIRPKGRKVIVRFKEELSNGHWYHIDPDKVFKGLLFRDKDGVEKLKIPRRFSKVSIEAPNLDDLLPSNKGTYVVELVKDAEELYRPTKIVILDDKSYREKVEQRESMGWYFSEKERSDKKYAKNDFWTKYGGLVTIGVLGICALLIIYGTGQQVNEINEGAFSQRNAELNNQRSFMLEIVNNIKGETPNTVDTSPNVDKPPSRTG